MFSTGKAKFANRRPDWELPALDLELNLSSHTILDDNCKGRLPCPKCGRSRSLYCYDCLQPLTAAPVVALPFSVSIITHHEECRSKNTGVHAAMLAPSQVSLHSIDACPAFNRERTIVLFPADDAVDVADLAPDSVDHVVIIDSKWERAQKLFRNPALAGVRGVRLAATRTAFWRFHTHGVASEGVCTIECLLHLCRQMVDQGKITAPKFRDPHVFDDLLWYFAYQHERIASAAAQRAAALEQKQQQQQQQQQQHESTAAAGSAAALAAEGSSTALGHSAVGQQQQQHQHQQRQQQHRPTGEAAAIAAGQDSSPAPGQVSRATEQSALTPQQQQQRQQQQQQVGLAGGAPQAAPDELPTSTSNHQHNVPSGRVGAAAAAAAGDGAAAATSHASVAVEQSTSGLGVVVHDAAAANSEEEQLKEGDGGRIRLPGGEGATSTEGACAVKRPKLRASGEDSCQHSEGHGRLVEGSMGAGREDMAMK